MARLSSPLGALRTFQDEVSRRERALEWSFLAYYEPAKYTIQTCHKRTRMTTRDFPVVILLHHLWQEA